MPMTDLDRELYELEVLKIRRDLNVPDDMPVFILDATEESMCWMQRGDHVTEENRKEREKFLAENNREEGGE